MNETRGWHTITCKQAHPTTTCAQYDAHLAHQAVFGEDNTAATHDDVAALSELGSDDYNPLTPTTARNCINPHHEHFPGDPVLPECTQP